MPLSLVASDQDRGNRSIGLCQTGWQKLAWAMPRWCRIARIDRPIRHSVRTRATGNTSSRDERLIASLRRQRKQSKAVQDTLASLRQIQALSD